MRDISDRGVNGKEGLESRWHPDLVLCDIFILGMSGHGLSAPWRHPNFQYTVHFLTALIADDVIRGKPEAINYLFKPSISI